MKYLGILMVVALVFVGSVAMADLISSGTDWALYGWNSVNVETNNNSCQVNFKLQVIVYPYLKLEIDNTTFDWRLYKALGSSSDVYYPSEEGIQVTQVRFTTNWPSATIAWSDVGDWDSNPPTNLDAEWKVKSGSYTIFGWGKPSSSGQQTVPIQHQYQPPQHPTGDHYEIFNRIKIPRNTKPNPGIYVDTFTVTATMAQ